MEENNKENPEVKVSGKKPAKKAKKIIISVVIIAIIVIAALLALFFTGHLNLTKGAKAWEGIEKMGETFSEPIDELSESYKTKISENLGEKPIEYQAEISAKVDELEVTGMSSSDKQTVDDIIELLDGSKINLDLKVDTKEKDYAGKISASIKDVIENISADIVYKDNTVAFRSEDINEDYLAISKDSLEESEYDEYAEIFDAIEGLSLEDSKELMFSEEEIKHFKDTYKDILKKELKDKDMKTSSDKVKVDGKSKKCTKVVVTLDDSDVADLVSSYIDTFKDDDEGKEIIKEKAIKIAELADQDLDSDDIDEFFDEFIEEAESMVDEIEFDGNVKITTYATATKTYRTDVEIEIDDETANLQFVYNKDNTEITLNVAEQEIGTLKIVNEKNNKEFKLSLNEEVVGQKIEAGLQFKNEDKRNTTVLTFNGEIEGVEAKVTLTEEETRTTDTDKELARENKLSFDIDVTNLVTAKGSITIKNNMKVVDSVDIPEITSENSVQILTDEEGLEEYLTNAQTGAAKILEELENSKFLQEYMDYIY